MEKYHRQHPSLTETEIDNIHKIFQDLNPDSQGFIDKKRIMNYCSKLSQSDYFTNEYNKYNQINFENFLLINGEFIKIQKGKYKNVEYETESKDVHCVFCPTMK